MISLRVQTAEIATTNDCRSDPLHHAFTIFPDELSLLIRRALTCTRTFVKSHGMREDDT
jgi:hypothetical protein